MTVRSALDVLDMDVAVITLKRRIARRVTILAARRRENAVDLKKRCLGRARVWIW
jgi:hypothetical protein